MPQGVCHFTRYAGSQDVDPPGRIPETGTGAGKWMHCRGGIDVALMLYIIKLIRLIAHIGLYWFIYAARTVNYGVGARMV
jgi:hypothetical protein